MAIEFLKSILVPPSHAIEVPEPGDWQQAEAACAITFPRDFKEFIETYGSGTICDFMAIFNPFSQNTYLKFFDASQRHLNAYRALQSERPGDCKFPAFPEEGGILPFGGNDNGDLFCWLTNGDADNWKTIVFEGRGPDYVAFPGCMSELLAAMLRGSVRSNFLPDITCHQPFFRPSQLR